MEPTQGTFYSLHCLQGHVASRNTIPILCPVVPGSNPASPQPTADCQSPGGLPPGMALGCGLTSVRGNRGENYANEPLVRQKHKKNKKPSSLWHHFEYV
jgi:hypothetical protein